MHVRFTMSMSRLETLHALRIEILGHCRARGALTRVETCSLSWSARCLAVEAGAGGADRIRTDDPLLAKQVLSQLSYSPLVSSTRKRRKKNGGPGRI